MINTMHWVFAALTLTTSATAWAQTPTTTQPAEPATRPAPTEPGILHEAPWSALALQEIPLRFTLILPQRIDQLRVHWRSGPQGAWQSLQALRAGQQFEAIVPAPAVETAAVEYWVEIVTPEGASIAAFASPAAPHRVVVRVDETDDAEQDALVRNQRIRLELGAGFEFTSFGARPNTGNSVCGESAGASCRDDWMSAYGFARYRFFRRVRSVSARINWLDGVTTRTMRGTPQQTQVGLVAATVGVEFSLHPTITVGFHGILGANEETVQGGGGLHMEFGTDRPTTIQLAFSGITSFGIVGSAWMRWNTVPNTPLGAGVEVTTQPGNNSDPGLRLLAEIGRRFHRRFLVTLRGGYGARLESAAGFTAGIVTTVMF